DVLTPSTVTESSNVKKCVSSSSITDSSNIQSSSTICTWCKQPTLKIPLCVNCSTYKQDHMFRFILERLRTAAGKGFQTLQEECNRMTPIVDSYPVIFNPIEYVDPTDKHYPKDTAAQSYLDKYCEKEWQSYIPVQVAGDGNCFYNSFIKLSPSLNMTPTELRTRNVLELVKNSSIYRKQYENLPVCLDHLEKYVTTEMVIDTVYSSVWDILSITNVLNIRLTIVYPKVNGNSDKIASSLNKTFSPISNGQPKHDVVLMFSSCSKECISPKLEKAWMPNHFVPLLRIRSNINFHGENF
ncbi:unnamed protein product, partial [Didymodactylos carnosus]